MKIKNYERCKVKKRHAFEFVASSMEGKRIRHLMRCSHCGKFKLSTMSDYDNKYTEKVTYMDAPPAPWQNTKFDK